MQPKHSMHVRPHFYQRSWFSLLIFCVIIFLLSFCFFYSIHPLVFFDTDDWAYLTYPRAAIPTLGDWNPTRVFPEVVMPIVAAFAGYVVAPFMGGNFLDATIWANAFAAALFIAVYIGVFTVFVKQQFKLKTAWVIMLGCLFFLMHFLVLRGLPEENTHLFWSPNVTSFYFYTLPNIFCATLLLYVLSNNAFDDFFTSEHLTKKALLVLATYLALFSNLFASIIIAAFAGIVLIVRLYKKVRQGFNFKEFCSCNAAWLVFIISWFLVQLLEAMGGRAASFSGGSSYAENLQTTVANLTTLPISKVFCLLVVVAVVAYIIVLYQNRSNEKTPDLWLPIVLLAAGLLALAYTVLVVAKVDCAYILRADVMFSVLFYLIMIAMTCCALLIKYFPRAVLCLPLLMLLIVFYTYTNGNTFQDVNIVGLTPETAYAVTQDIIEQIEQADDDGLTTMELKVPEAIGSDNFPLAIYGGEQEYFSRTALKMGLIENDIAITVVPDPAKSAEFNLTTERFVR